VALHSGLAGLGCGRRGSHLAGVALAIWAPTILGRNWSATVTVKKDHTLVRSRPYTAVRHPIFSGLLRASLGTALAIGEVHSLLAEAIGPVGFRIKSKLEEQFMMERFGREYEEYRQHSWALVPFVLWRETGQAQFTCLASQAHVSETISPDAEIYFDDPLAITLTRSSISWEVRRFE